MEPVTKRINMRWNVFIFSSRSEFLPSVEKYASEKQLNALNSCDCKASGTLRFLFA
jgi:hypothetical protein